MRVYLSARFERQSELKRYAADLRKAGIDVGSRWLGASLDDETCNAEAAAVADLLDVIACDVLIAFTDQPSRPRGGRHVEFGIAVGLSLGMRPGAAIRLIVVGPNEHVFHALPGVEHVGSWAEAFARVAGRELVAGGTNERHIRDRRDRA